jgi:4-cresol dehydrogenase (hydroxylating)
MEFPNFVSALEEMATVLGQDNVILEGPSLQAYAQNTAGLERRIAAAVTPGSTLEVQSVVQIANRYRTPLYPISCGRNWGYGSSLPVRDGAVVVDLHRMNRIRNTINLADHYAAVEPGVTQEQLWRALQESGLPLLFNATAAGRETSILGNSLDRGFGYFAMRPDDLCGLEVVLGTGEVLRTGYGHYENARATANYKFGLGPSLDGLFFQSNFGIVTCASLHLHARRERHATLLLKLQRDEDFVAFVDRLAGLRREGVFESVLHIGSRDRIRVTLSPLIYQYLVKNGESPGADLRRRAESLLAGGKFAAWTGVGGIYGSAGEVEEKLKEISRRLEDLAMVEAVTAETFARSPSSNPTLEERAVLESAKALADFSSGTPADGALFSPLWAIGLSPDEVVNLDRTPLGLLFCCPALPLSGEAAKEAIETARRIFQQFGFTPYMTLNIVNTKAMLCVLNLVFDRRVSEQVRTAHRCVDTLFDDWASQGIYPYRLGVQSMGQFVTAGDPFWQIVRGLKEVFDPNRIIAPGRYNLV